MATRYTSSGGDFILYDQGEDAAFAQSVGLPGDTALLTRPDGTTTYWTHPDGSVWTSDQTGAGDFAKTTEEEAKPHTVSKKRPVPPPPTAPDPPPPEIIPDDQEAIAVSTSPDVVRVGGKPTPMPVYGKASDDQNYSPNVFSNGKAIKGNNGQITTTRGDEPGDPNGGVKSNTVQGTVDPTSSSPVVRVNGNPIQRHSDTCTLNNTNCPGKYIYVKRKDVDPPPSGKDEQQDTRSGWQKFGDGFSENLGQTWEGVKSVASNTWDGTTQLASDLYSDPLGTVGAGAQNVADAAVGAGQWTGEVATNMWYDPAGTMQRGVDNTLETGGAIWHGVSDPYVQAYQKGGIAQAIGYGSADVVKLAVEAALTKGAATAAGKMGEVGSLALKGANRVEGAEDLAKDARQAEKALDKATEDGKPGGRSTREEEDAKTHCITCKTGGNPVLIATGRPTEQDPGFGVAWPLPLDIGSAYHGDLDHCGPLGHRRTAGVDSFIVATDDGRLRLIDAAPWPVYFPRPSAQSGLWERGESPRRIEIVATPKGGLRVREGDRLSDYALFEDGVWRLAAIGNGTSLSIAFRRDDSGMLESIAHPSGLTLAFDNDIGKALRLAAHVVAPSGERRTVLRYDYDGENNLISVDAPYGGGSVQYAYDTQHRLIETRKGHGYRSQRVYDEQGRVIVTHTNGPHDGNRFEYDDALRAMTFRHGVGEDSLERYYLNEHRAITAQANGLGHFQWNDYRDGRLVAVTDAEGNRTDYGYDARGQLQSVRDGEGRETYHVHDGAGRVRIAMDAAGHTWKYDYDERGALSSITDPLGHRTEIVNDEAGLPVRIMRHDGLLEQRDYDACHRLIALRDYRGELTRFGYDEFGRLTSVIDPLGQVTRYGYDDAGGLDFWQPSRLERPDGVVVTTSASAQQIERRVVDGEGRQTVYRHGFGPDNRLTEIEDAKGGRLRFGYDGLERLVSVTNQLGRVWTFERDAAGRVIREEDFDGLVIDYAYDRADRLIETRHADGSRLAFAYDRSGLLVREEAYAPLGPAQHAEEVEPVDVTRYWYDGRALLEKAENKAALVEYERDAMGRIVAETVNGRRVENSYDCCGNRTERRMGGRLVASAYDPLGALQSLMVGDHAPLAFERDGLGRELARTSAAGFALRQDYDAVGQLVSQRMGTNTNDRQTLGGVGLGGASGDGMDAIRRAGHAMPILERQYGWDKAFAPVTIAEKAWGDLDYSYDENGQILRTRFGDGGGERFRYDAALNTAGFGEGSAAGTEALGLTPSLAGSGYLGTQTEKGIQGWLLSEGGRVRLATGPHGERIELEHDVRGRVVRRKLERKGFRPTVWRYEWDAKDRLVRCLTPEGEAWRYGYDPFGRRVWKVRELTVPEMRLHAAQFPALIDASAVAPDYASMLRPPPSERRRPVMGAAVTEDLDRPPVVGIAYGWDGDVIAEEAPLRLDGAIDWDAATRWHYEPSSFRPLAKETPDGRLHYIVTDHLGTPREMFEENGKLTWAAEYRTWGEVRRLWLAEVGNDNRLDGGGQAMYPRGEKAGKDETARMVGAPSDDGWNSDGGDSIAATTYPGGRLYGSLALKEDPIAHEARFVCPIRFQGQWEDEESGLYYNRFRHYDPLAGQYVSPDPIGFIGGLNVQSYGQRPSMMVDPLGLAGVTITPAPPGSGYDFVMELQKSVYPETAGHIEDAIKAGKSAIMTPDRIPNEIAKRRRASLKGVACCSGKDRDEWPMAMTKEGGNGASVRPINPSDNRGAGSSIGSALKAAGISDGQRIMMRIVP
ncbi:RHS repeat-associated core domain-containing protein [Labrys sp. 22185]|uniref:RHS repeat-associated core domain-containing protein n=1 Tax=Labrys sp. 22185 TaxID=3453888 RepID=UPI003F826F98